MDSSWRAGLPYYVLAVLAVLGATVLTAIFWPLIESGLFGFYLVAIALVAWAGGFRVGLLALVLSTLLLLYFFMPPYGTLLFEDAGLMRLILFLALGGILLGLAASRRDLIEATRRARDELDTILGGIADGVTAQLPDGRLRYANDAAARLSSIASAAAMMQMPLTEVMARFEVFDEDGLSLTLDDLPGRLALQGHPAQQRIVCFRARGGGPERWSIVRATPIFDRAGRVRMAINIFQDITDLKIAQQTAYEQREWFRVTLGSIGDAVIATDTAARVTFLNTAGENLTGWTQDEAAGQDVRAVFNIVNEQTGQPADNPVYRVLREGVIVGLANHTALVRRDGSHIPIDDSGAHIHDAEGRVIGAVLVFRDIAERRRAEAEQARLTTQLAEERARLDALIANVPGIVWEAWGDPLDFDAHKNDFVSAYAETMLGYSPAAWRDDSSFWLKVVHPADRERNAILNADLFAHGGSRVDEIRLLTADGSVIWAETHTSVITDGLGKVVGLRGIVVDITERRRAEDAQAFLSQASVALASSLDYEATLASVSKLAVPTIADWCRVDIVQDDGTLALLDVAHVNPDKVAWGHEINRRYPPDPDARSGLYEVIRSGKPEFYPLITDEMLHAATTDSDLLDILHEIGYTSVITVPMMARGRTLGAITLVTAESGRRYDESDVELAQELAVRAALAVDNARLYRAERRAHAEAEAARERQAFLADSSAVLVSTLDYRKRFENLARLCVPFLSDWCIVDMLEDDGALRRIAVAHRDPAKAHLAQRLHEAFPVLRPGQHHTLRHVLDTGQAWFRPVMTDEQLAQGARSREHLDLLRALGYTGEIVVPLSARGRTLGTITFVLSSDERTYTPEDLALAEELARRAALAVDNMRLFGEAREQEERLRVTLASIGDAVIATDETGDITFANPVAQVLTGWPADEAVGRPLEDVFHVVDEDDRAQVENPVSRVLREQTVTSLSGRALLLDRQGREIPVDDSAAPIRDENGAITGVVLVFRDITDRRRTENLLQNAYRRVKELYEISHRIGTVRSLDEILQALVESPSLEHINQASLVVFDRPWDGVPPDEYEVLASLRPDLPVPGAVGSRHALKDHPLAMLFERDAPTLIPDVRHDPRVNEGARTVFASIDTCSLMIFPLKSGGAWYGVMTIQSKAPHVWSEDECYHIQGIVDQIGVATDRIRLFELEAQARREAEAANDLKLKFLAMISHELRTPLTSIKGFATTLLADDVAWDTGSQRDFIEIINEEADKLTDLIEQLLDLSRLQAGTLRIEPQPQLLTAVLEIALAELAIITTQHDLRLDLAPDLPPVHVDQDRIAQVVVNLVNNAVKFSPPQSQIRIAAYPQDGQVCVEVSYQGPGILPEDRVMVFEAFRQAEGQSARQNKGAVLGLAICKGLVEAHGGHIWIMDRDWAGTTIAFTLPAA